MVMEVAGEPPAAMGETTAVEMAATCKMATTSTEVTASDATPPKVAAASDTAAEAAAATAAVTTATKAAPTSAAPTATSASTAVSKRIARDPSASQCERGNESRNLMQTKRLHRRSPFCLIC
jgi:hypothetical protein